jgi:CRP-like cAMP-binding protein
MRITYMRYTMCMIEQDVAKKIKTFFVQFPSRIYKKGDVLIHPEDEAKQIYYLERGHVRQYTVTKDGEDLTINVYKQGAFFPMAYVVDGYKNTYIFEVMDSSSLRVAEFKTVVAFIKQQPDVLFNLLQRLYSGMSGVLSQVEQLMSGNARKRLLTALLISAKRFGQAKEADIHIPLKFTHQDLAALTGLTRETVSREMIKLKQEGLIEYANILITVKNIQKIEEELR